MGHRKPPDDPKYRGYANIAGPTRTRSVRRRSGLVQVRIWEIEPNYPRVTQQGLPIPMPQRFRKELELEELPAPEGQFWGSYWINLLAARTCRSGGFWLVGGTAVGGASGVGSRFSAEALFWLAFARRS